MEILTLAFLGQRTYLQGTTLFNALAPRLAGAEQIHFQCRKVIFSDRVTVSSGDGALPPAARREAWLTWQHAGAPRWLSVEAAPPSAQPAREPYDESRLTQLATLDGDALTLTVDSPFPFVSTFVALHKFLLLAQPGERRAGQWLFTGLKLSRWPQHLLPLRLQIRHLLAGLAARTAISCGAEPLGEIEFVWHAQNLHTAPTA